MKLFTNTNYKRDILYFELEKWGRNTNIEIASAFFNESDLIKKFQMNNCSIKLIVRLCNATDPYSLKEIIKLPNVYVRYFTGKIFHPKFYIFNNGIAILGSSNLTKSGINTNNEVNISIELDNPIFSELKDVFNTYWDSAVVLDQGVIDKYIEIYEKSDIGEANKIFTGIDKELITEFGKVELSDIKEKIKKEKKTDYIDDFKRKYQLFLSNFDFLKNTYIENNKRKDKTETLPVRIEIDQFFNWIRNEKCHKEDYITAKVRKNEDLKNNCIININEYIQSNMKYFDYVVNESYPKIKSIFSSEENINNISENELKDGLSKIHSFYDQLRFFPGGFDSFFKIFIDDNGIEKIKKSINYVLFSKTESFINRIVNYLFNDEYRLKNFSDSCVKELYGWINNEDIPIYNNRTYYGMRWLGFGDW